jgi:hypothetical protein
MKLRYQASNYPFLKCKANVQTARGPESLPVVCIDVLGPRTRENFAGGDVWSCPATCSGANQESRWGALAPCDLRVKANEAKKMVPWVLRLCTRFNDGSQHDTWRHGVLWCLNRYYEIINLEPRYLSALQVADLQAAVTGCLRCYNALNEESQENLVRHRRSNDVATTHVAAI